MPPANMHRMGFVVIMELNVTLQDMVTSFAHLIDLAKLEMDCDSVCSESHCGGKSAERRGMLRMSAGKWGMLRRSTGAPMEFTSSFRGPE